MIDVESIRALVAPVVMISAQGLICLALYNRLAAVVGRLRMFSREQFDVRLHVGGTASTPHDDDTLRAIQARLQTLDDQYAGVLRRAGLLRNALILLQSGVLAMLICILFLGVSLLLPGMESWSLVPFFIGILATASGIAISIHELATALEPAKAEQNSFR